jgi:hypothetical protein
MKTNKFLHYVLSFFLLIAYHPAYGEGGTTDPKEPKKPTCENGLIYNEHAKVCVNSKDNKMLNNKHKECSWSSEGASRDECMQKVADFGKDNTKGLSTATDDKQLGMKALKGAAGIGTMVGAHIGTAAAIASATKTIEEGCTVVNATLKAESAGKGAFCYSAMMSLGAFVLSLFNSSETNKNAKKAVEEGTKDLKKLLAENKKTKGKSYEMQIKLMEAYKKALDGGSRAAQIRIDGHKSEITSHTVVGAAALIEWGVASICPGPTCNAVRASCAMWTSISAGVGLGISKKMLGISEDAKKKYDKESKQLAEILAKYRAFFDQQVIDSQSLPSLANTSNIRGSSPTNVRADGTGVEVVQDAETITEFSAQICSMDSTSPCCDNGGQECQVISINGAPSYILEGFEQNEGDEVISNLNKILNGEGSFGDDDVSLAIDKNLRKAKLMKRKIKEGLVNSNIIKKSDLDKFDDEKNFKKYLKEKYGDENYNFGVNDSLASTGVEDKKDEEGDTKEEKIAANAEGIKIPTLKIPTFKKPDFSDLDDDDDNNPDLLGTSGGSGTSLKDGEEYVYKDEDIVKKPSVSIFNIISNRYNIMRLKKGFGKKQARK